MTISGHRNWSHAPENAVQMATAYTGTLIGSTIRRKMLNSDPPSTRAAWITESGMVSKNPLNSRKLNAWNTIGMITAQCVSQILMVGNSASVPGMSGGDGNANGKFRVSR